MCPRRQTLSRNCAKRIGRRIYSFIRRRGYSPADAQDLTQSFFAFFLRTKAYARTDRLHGKFRSFLLSSVKNFLADNRDRDQAIKRGGDYQFVFLDQETAEVFYDPASASDSSAEPSGNLPQSASAKTKDS